MEMEDPTLMTAIGAPWGLPIPAESEKIREHLYVHMWASFWAGNYVVGEMTNLAVRKIASGELLNSKAGRAYWAAVRDNLLSTNQGRYRRFARIVDEEYQKILMSNAPTNESVRITEQLDNFPSSRQRKLRQLALIGATLMAGVLAGRKSSRYTRRMR